MEPLGACYSTVYDKVDISLPGVVRKETFNRQMFILSDEDPITVVEQTLRIEMEEEKPDAYSKGRYYPQVHLVASQAILSAEE